MANLALKRSAGTDPPRPATCGAEMLQVSAKVMDTMREAVVIMDGKVRHAVLLELFTEHGAGTLLGKSRDAAGA